MAQTKRRQRFRGFDKTSTRKESSKQASTSSNFSWSAFFEWGLEEGAKLIHENTLLGGREPHGKAAFNKYLKERSKPR